MADDLKVGRINKTVVTRAYSRADILTLIENDVKLRSGCMCSAENVDRQAEVEKLIDMYERAVRIANGTLIQQDVSDV